MDGDTYRSNETHGVVAPSTPTSVFLLADRSACVGGCAGVGIQCVVRPLDVRLQLLVSCHCFVSFCVL